MQEMATNSSMVTYTSIGQSYEGREIGQVTIRTGEAGTKQIIFLECGIHAREWVTEASCIWIFDQVRRKILLQPNNFLSSVRSQYL